MNIQSLISAKKAELAQAVKALSDINKSVDGHETHEIEHAANAVSQIREDILALEKAAATMVKAANPLPSSVRRAPQASHLDMFKKGLTQALEAYVSGAINGLPGVAGAILANKAATDVLATTTTGVDAMLPSIFRSALPVLGKASLYSELLARTTVRGSGVAGQEVVFPYLADSDLTLAPVQEGNAIPVLAGLFATQKISSGKRAGIWCATEEALARCAGLGDQIMAGITVSTSKALDDYALTALQADEQTVAATDDAIADVAAAQGKFSAHYDNIDDLIVVVSKAVHLKLCAARDTSGNIKYGSAIARLLNGARIIPVSGIADADAYVIKTASLALNEPVYSVSVSRDAVVHMDAKAPAADLHGAQPVVSAFQSGLIATRVICSDLAIANLYGKRRPAVVRITGLAGKWVA